MAKSAARKRQTRLTKPVSDVSHIKDLIPDPQNRRKHNPRNVGMIADSLKAIGPARSIVIDEDNIIRAGNGTIAAAAEAGITKVRVVEADGNEIIAVRRRGLSVEEKRRLAMDDNRAAELAEWNPEQLQADAAAGLDLRPWFSEKEEKTVLVRAHERNVAGEGVSEELKSQFLVVVTCRSEQEQVRLLERFCGEGLECKALVS